jgi:H+-transporting ATPase
MFYLGLNFFHLAPDMLRTLIYLSLSIGGILTLINARTRGAFWSIRPARPLLIATIGAMVAATFIAVYGGLMAPLGWHLAGVVWAYSAGMFLIQDRVKLMGYQIFSKQHSGLFGRHVRAEEE